MRIATQRLASLLSSTYIVVFTMADHVTYMNAKVLSPMALQDERVRNYYSTKSTVIDVY